MSKSDARAVAETRLQAAEDTDRQTIRKAFGSDNPEFAQVLLGQIAQIAETPGGGHVDQIDFGTLVVLGAEPRDQMEAMLAVQMSAVHNATMRFASKLVKASHPREVEFAEKALNRLARTYGQQMDALKRYRSVGQQVVVKHVTVNDGGQAIVGDVNAGGGKQ